MSSNEKQLIAMHIHVARSAQTIPPHAIVVLAGAATMVKKFVMQCNRQAWDIVSRHAVEDLVEFLHQTLPEAENQWDVIKGFRQNCVPYDVYNNDFWNDTNPSQWETAMTVCTWAKAKREQVVERWLDAGGICRRFNNRIDGAVNWPDDVIEELLEDILGILDPLVDLDRLDEVEQFRAEGTTVIWLQMMD